MLKLPLSAPRPSTSSGSQPTSRIQGSRCLRTSLRSKVSLPAGTGVWVVKTVVPLHRRERLGQAVAHPHALAGPLEGEEGHVALVHVPDRGVDPERAQGAHAADPVHDLLAQAHLAPAARRGCR